MSNAHNPQHWSQLDTEEQIRFWQGVEDGHVASFLVSPEKKSTRRRRGEHSTKPKCENPTWFRPEHYKKLGGQLGHAYNRLVQKDRTTELLPSLRDGPRPENHISYSIHKEVNHKTGAGLPARCPSPPLKSAAAPGRRPGNTIAFNDGCCNYFSSSLWVELRAVLWYTLVSGPSAR